MIVSFFEIGKNVASKFPSGIKVLALVYNLINLNIYRTKGSRNNVIKSKAFLNRCKFEIKGNGNTIIIDDMCVLKNCHINISGNDNKIWLNKKVCAYDLEVHIEDNNNEVIIGERTLFSGKTHLACIEGTKISIGNDCLFSSEIVFRTGDSHSILDQTGNRINQSRNIIISNNVWVGHRVLVNKGARIAEQSVVGTGAIVTKSFTESNVVIAGVPAKIMKRNINWNKVRI